MVDFRCKECNREFHGQQALEDHNRSKHFVKSMDKVEKSSSLLKNKYVWIFVGIVVIVLVLWATPSINSDPSKYDEFAQCLTDNGAVMYGAFWCPHCAETKKNFGSSFQYIVYVECDPRGENEQAELCIEKEIERYDTWEFTDGSRVIGEPTFEQLSEGTGCPVPEEEK